MPEPVSIGNVDPGAQPVDVPDDGVLECGHCGGILGSPEPDQWLLGTLNADAEPRVAVLQSCYSCALPTVVVWGFHGDAAGQAVPRRHTQSPPPPPPPLKAAQYRGTDIEAYHQEAWRCRRAGLRRAALVLARSTLQACYRRYLPLGDRGSFTSEQTKVGALAGEGWQKVATGVRDFGNTWAHPEGSAERPHTEELRDAFVRMEAVLAFTAELERVGYLKVSDVKGSADA